MSNNGLKFLSSRCQELFRNLVIIHQRTNVYTPQQNGVVERKHRHLLQVAKSLMILSRTPLKFWEEIILATTYLINRTLSPILD